MPLAACNRGPESVSFMVFGDPAEFAVYQTLVDAFQKEHEDIIIELIHFPSQSDYRKRLAANLAAGTPSDVVLINYRRYAQFAVQGALEPLAPYLAKSELIAEEDFYSQSIEPFTWNGQLMCIPQNLSSPVVYYNKSILAPAMMGASPLFILLFYWSFRRVPAEQDESTRLDGATPLLSWRLIGLPQVRLALLAVGLLAFLFFWNDFINPLLYLKSTRLYTLPVGLMHLQELDKTNWPLLMAASTLIPLPPVMVFLWLQKALLGEQNLVDV